MGSADTDWCDEHARGNNRNSCREVNEAPSIGDLRMQATVDIADRPKIAIAGPTALAVAVACRIGALK